MSTSTNTMYWRTPGSCYVTGAGMGSGLLAGYPLTMYPPYGVFTIPSPKSTPSLELDSVEHYDVYSSPSDDYLTTPEVSEWREIGISEHGKDRKLAGNYLDLPVLEACKQEPVVSDFPPELPPWPHTTISPEDAFPDYAEVRKYLQEQARSSSPISEDESVERDLPCCAEVNSSPLPAPPTPALLPVRSVGKRTTRDEDDSGQEEPAPKRQRQHLVSARVDVVNSSPLPAPVSSSVGRSRAKPQRDEDTDGQEPVPKRRRPQVISTQDDSDIDSDDDGSGCFQPPSCVKHRVSTHRTKTKRSPAAAKPAKCNRGEDYEEGPCSCRAQGCQHCVMTCFYTFVHGQRKGEVCRRLFEKNRHLDLKRHKAAHAVQEWKLLEDGDITREDAYWHLVVFGGKEHGLICPNGNCPTTFTRYDALKRHIERGTCQHGISFHNLDNRQLKAMIMKASKEKRARMAGASKTA